MKKPQLYLETSVWNFCFAVSVGSNGLPEHRREQLQQAIYDFKPAHTKAQIIFVDSLIQ